MEKFDARKLPRDAQEEMRRQAMRMRASPEISFSKRAGRMTKQEEEMFKIPKQEFTAEIKELAIKRVKSGQ